MKLTKQQRKVLKFMARHGASSVVDISRGSGVAKVSARLSELEGPKIGVVFNRLRIDRVIDGDPTWWYEYSISSESFELIPSEVLNTKPKKIVNQESESSQMAMAI